MSVAVIVINFRTPAYTIDCLESLARVRDEAPGLRVWLVENASGDDSLPRLREYLAGPGRAEWITLLPQEKNLGFAGGNGAAQRLILADPQAPPYVLLLNSDTLVHPGCLRAALDRMRREPDIGVLSCMLRNRDGSVQNVCRLLPTPLRETVRVLGLPYLFRRSFSWADLEDKGWDRETTARDVEWVGGAFMLIPTALLREIGGLDESFYFYGEDMEFCHRIWKSGRRVFFDPAGSITHFGGGSSDSAKLADIRRRTLRWKARLHVQRVCYGPAAAVWLRALSTLLVRLRLLAFTLAGRRDHPDARGAVEELDILVRGVEQPT
jgi:N-acetylglucosaminyl-diphospho-decaprenol L-rhamnosyltransferase